MTEDVEKLASLVLDFGRIDRITAHQDGIQPESDTDHTVMLGIIGIAVASKLYPTLNTGLIAEFALVHDLVEVYAGDVPTLTTLTKELLQQKKDNEDMALERLRGEVGDNFNYIIELIEKYERLDTKEARFVKVLDKIMPKITAILNCAKKINDNRLTTQTEAVATYAIQKEKLQKIAYDMPELLDLYDYFIQKSVMFIKQ